MYRLSLNWNNKWFVNPPVSCNEVVLHVFLLCVLSLDGLMDLPNSNGFFSSYCILILSSYMALQYWIVSQIVCIGISLWHYLLTTVDDNPHLWSTITLSSKHWGLKAMSPWTSNNEESSAWLEVILAVHSPIDQRKEQSFPQAHAAAQAIAPTEPSHSYFSFSQFLLYHFVKNFRISPPEWGFNKYAFNLYKYVRYWYLQYAGNVHTAKKIKSSW
jgi:hypothetical protein